MFSCDFSKYIDLLRELLDDYRYNHCLCVADEAERLSLLYGGDPLRARLAGLLHDITKNYSKEQHLKIFESSGIILSEHEKSSPKLWHAISGAAFVKNEGLVNDDEIISAVRYHTTAKSGMTLLEKIVYLADFTSADRKYPDVDVMRRLVDISIDDAMEYSLKYTVCDLINKGVGIHPDTIAAYNEIILKKLKGESN